MSVILVKTICSILMSIVGLVVVKNISGSETKLISFKTVVLMLPLMAIPAITYNMNYSFVYTIVTFALTIIVYKEILNISYIKSIISSGIMLITLFILEVISMLLLAPFAPVSFFRNSWFVNLILNFVFMTITVLLYQNTKLCRMIKKFIIKIESRKSSRIILGVLLTIIAMSTIAYILSNNFSINTIFTTNFLLFITFVLLILILFGERNNYDKLSDEYDSLFNYVKVFEDWIEKEQLNRHEFKNQMAVLRCMTKEKKVQDKIDSIINENINIDKEMISQLKNLPSGGFKGLLYYKIAQARKKKIHLEVDVGDDVNKPLNKLSDKELEVLSKLIGIYTDNAMEASIETKKKLVSIEIYSYDENINIVITNTFNKENDISNRHEKGVSTKGEGRGNGLYFAKKMLSKNKWISEQQDIVDNLYIERLVIKCGKRKQVHK